MTDPAASSELSQQYYREGFELLKLEHFVESLEKFGKSAELRNKTTPDMYRNQGWCLFRLAEQGCLCAGVEKCRREISAGKALLRESSRRLSPDETTRSSRNLSANASSYECPIVDAGLLRSAAT
jgi:hypothetical protein